MRTTIDIPDSVFRKAKAAASLRGMSLKVFIRRAIERGLSAGALPLRGHRVRLPLVRSRRPASVDLSSKRIARLLDDEDRGLPF